MWKNLFNLFRKDDLLTQALRESHAMLDLDLKIFEASVSSLRRSDSSEVEVDIYLIDKKINAYERDVRRKVLTHLSFSGSADLASGLILVSVVIDIERIGDYAKNIHDLARAHSARLAAKSLEPEVAAIEERVAGLFRDTVAAFRTSDVEKSRAIMVDYKEGLSARCDDLVNRIVSGRVTDLSGGEAAAIALYVRYLKRIGAHSRNIITSVVNPFHRIGYREKTDRSSRTAS